MKRPGIRGPGWNATAREPEELRDPDQHLVSPAERLAEIYREIEEIRFREAVLHGRAGRLIDELHGWHAARPRSLP